MQLDLVFRTTITDNAGSLRKSTVMRITPRIIEIFRMIVHPYDILDISYIQDEFTFRVLLPQGANLKDFLDHVSHRLTDEQIQSLGIILYQGDEGEGQDTWAQEDNILDDDTLSALGYTSQPLAEFVPILTSYRII